MKRLIVMLVVLVTFSLVGFTGFDKGQIVDKLDYRDSVLDCEYRPYYAQENNTPKESQVYR